MTALDELLMSADVLAQIHDVRYAQDVSCVKDVQERVRSAQDDASHGARAVYGISVVEKAVQNGAVGAGGGVLLVNKSLFGQHRFRDAVCTLANAVREEGGNVRICNDIHECGQRLETLGGIAALLTFSLFDLEDVEDAEADADNTGGTREGQS